MKILTKHMSEKRCVCLLSGIIFVSIALFHSGCGNPTSEEGDHGGDAQFPELKQNENSESGKIKEHKYLSESQDAIFQEFLRLFGTSKNGQLALAFSGIYGVQPIDIRGLGVREKMPKYLGLLANRQVQVIYAAEIIIYQDKSYSMKFTAQRPNRTQQLQSMAYKDAGITHPWEIKGMVDTQTGIIKDIILYNRGLHDAGVYLNMDLGIKLKANSIEESARSKNGITKDSYYSCNLRFEAVQLTPKGETESVTKVFMKTKFPDANFLITDAELPSAVETNSSFPNKYKEFLVNSCYDEKQKKLWKSKQPSELDIFLRTLADLETENTNLTFLPIGKEVKITIIQGEKEQFFENSSHKLTEFGKNLLQQVFNLIPESLVECRLDSHSQLLDKKRMKDEIDPLDLSYLQGKEVLETLDSFSNGVFSEIDAPVYSHGYNRLKDTRFPNKAKINRRIEITLCFPTSTDHNEYKPTLLNELVNRGTKAKEIEKSDNFLNNIVNAWSTKLKTKEIENLDIKVEPNGEHLKIIFYQGINETLFENSSPELSRHGLVLLQRLSWFLSGNVLEAKLDSFTHRFDKSSMEGDASPKDLSYLQGKEIVEALDAYTEGTIKKWVKSINAYGQSRLLDQEFPDKAERNRRIELSLVLDPYTDGN